MMKHNSCPCAQTEHSPQLDKSKLCLPVSGSSEGIGVFIIYKGLIQLHLSKKGDSVVNEYTNFTKYPAKLS